MSFCKSEDASVVGEGVVDASSIRVAVCLVVDVAGDVAVHFCFEDAEDGDDRPEDVELDDGPPAGAFFLPGDPLTAAAGGSWKRSEVVSL